ncbi:hypothetical protein GDO81_029312 [Engystomops pustulosus]|uniref:Uncharacterized protein n=1 Tax=Engystomops pustulosus TaxID=76066 RepID=A0AAV6YIS1_ENGPU|nr:hypothetical protein GDO81_029312 [Engystomops pustulosus]
MQEKYTKPKEDKELSAAEKMMLSFHEEQEILPDTFLANFPSLIKVDIHKKVTDPSVAKGMMACLLSSLKANGEYKRRDCTAVCFIYWQHGYYESKT